jgi:hypothetical protein
MTSMFVWGCVKSEGSRPTQSAIITSSPKCKIYHIRGVISGPSYPTPSLYHNTLHSSVTTVSKIRAGRPTNRVSIYTGKKTLLSFSVQNVFWAHTVSFPAITAGSFTGVKIGRVVRLTTHHNIVPKLNCTSILTPPSWFRL